MLETNVEDYCFCSSCCLHCCFHVCELDRFFNRVQVRKVLQVAVQVPVQHFYFFEFKAAIFFEFNSCLTQCQVFLFSLEVQVQGFFIFRVQGFFVFRAQVRVQQNDRVRSPG